MANKIPDKNLFMMCEKLNHKALTGLPEAYHVRPCRRDELELWKAMPFDDAEAAAEKAAYMAQFYQDVYGNQESLFFEKCLFMCDQSDTPVGTCFAWKSYGLFTSIHWFKVLKGYEGRGIGRALLSLVLRGIKENEYPVFLHTQPASFRAIKLYSDVGFAFLTDPVIGCRTNDLEESLPILKACMPQKEYDKLRFSIAPDYFLRAAASSGINEF